MISWGPRSVSCQFGCGHGSFHSYMLLRVAKYCVSCYLVGNEMACRRVQASLFAFDGRQSREKRNIRWIRSRFICRFPSADHLNNTLREMKNLEASHFISMCVVGDRKRQKIKRFSQRFYLRRPSRIRKDSALLFYWYHNYSKAQILVLQIEGQETCFACALISHLST